jgi:hypothetical protein
LLESVSAVNDPVQGIRQQLEQAWLGAATRALVANRTTIALLPVRRLLQTDGVLKRLRERGFAVSAP